jgi:pimeloyl-ACP methyl ester carboxylesterase
VAPDADNEASPVAAAGKDARQGAAGRVRHRIVRANGIDIHVAEAGHGPTVVLLHGFPELWYSWRHQLCSLPAAGYHVIAPDLRGYGGTGAPADPRRYTLREHLADLTGMLDVLGVEHAALVGHDQGAAVAWAAAQLLRERFPALVALGVGFSPRAPRPLTEMILQNNPGKFNVVLYFQAPGSAEAELDADPAKTLRMTLHALSGDAPAEVAERWLLHTPEDSGYLDALPDPGPPSAWSSWLTDREFDEYVAAFRRTGFAGAIRRYRALDLDWSDLPEVGTIRVTQPTLFVAGEWDSAYRFSSLEPTYAMVPGLRDVVVLPGAGHWTQQECAGAVDEHLLAFLGDTM